MNLIADTHTHTIASTHAYGTVMENVHEAAKKELYAVAITDHGFAMPGSPGKWYFENLRALPRYLEGVLLLRGEEANITDFDGTTDLVPKDLDSLDWVVASFHKPVVEKLLGGREPTKKQVSDAWLAVAGNPHINVIGHCGTAEFEFEYEKVLPEFGRNGKLVELNEGTFSSRRDSVPNCVRIMLLCKQHGVPIIVDSDAHFPTRVGDCPHCQKLLEEIDFPEELVVNSSVERFQAYLKQYTRVFQNKVGGG